MRVPSVAGLALLLLSNPHDALDAQAPSSDGSRRAPFRIVIDQMSGDVESQGADGRVKQRWSAQARTSGRGTTVRVPSGVGVEIELRHTNPLLYRYDVQASVVATQSLPACRTVGSRLVMTGVFSTLATVAASVQPTLAPSIGQLFQPPPQTADAATRGDAVLTEAALTALWSEHEGPVTAYLRFLTTLQTLPRLIDDSLAVIAELAESQPIDSLLARFTSSLARVHPGLAHAVSVPAAVRAQVTTAQPHLDALRRAAGAIARGAFDGNAALGAAAAVTRTIQDVDAVEVHRAASIRALQAQLMRLDVARTRTVQRSYLEASSAIRRITIETVATNEYPDAYRARVGKQELLSEPSVDVLCQVSLGVAFMDQPASYALAGDVVTREGGEARSAVSVLLHAASARIPVLGILAGFGFGSDGFPDLYAGGSLRVLDPLMINFGAVWQRTQRLPVGYAVGVEAPDPSRLASLDTRYRPSLFWGVSFAR